MIVLSVVPTGTIHIQLHTKETRYGIQHFVNI